MGKVSSENISNNREIPLSIRSEWQDIVNIVTELEEVKATLILKITEDFLEILFSSQNNDNPYKAGEKQKLEDDIYFTPVIKDKSELIIADALSHERWHDSINANKGMISCICLPINHYKGESFGELCILDDKVNTFSKLHIHLLKYLRELIQYQLNNVVFNKALVPDSNSNSVAIISKDIPHFMHLCSFCRRIKDKNSNWILMEEFFSRYIDIYFSHGICDSCLEKHYGYLFKKNKESKKEE